MKRLALCVLLASASCTTIQVRSPSGCATAKVQTTTLFGEEQVSCIDDDTSTGTAGCTVGGQSAQQLIATIMGALTAAGVIAAAHPLNLRATAPAAGGCGGN